MPSTVHYRVPCDLCRRSRLVAVVCGGSRLRTMLAGGWHVLTVPHRGCLLVCPRCAWTRLANAARARRVMIVRPSHTGAGARGRRVIRKPVDPA